MKYKKFNKWCSESYHPPDTMIFQFNEYFKRYRGNEDPSNSWDILAIKEINDYLKNESIKQIDINRELQARHYTIGTEHKDNENYIDNVNVSTQGKGSIEFKNISIKRLNISLSSTDYVFIFNNCDISNLIITCVNNKQAHIEINNSRIGRFTISEKSIKYLKMNNGCILSINCPPAYGGNPFTGNVIFKNVFFPKSNKNYILKDEQGYRNITAHLEKLNNAHAAHLVHVSQLAVERRNDPFVSKIFSLFYQAFSNYGSSMLRPLVWIVVLWTLSAGLVWFVNGAELNLHEDYYKGWRYKLVAVESARLYKSFTLSSQEIVNPFGVFGARTLVVAKYPWLAMVGLVHSLLSTANIALLILAIRRRFKLK